MRFISERNLGFDRDQIIMVKNPVWDFDFTNRVKQRLADFAKTRSYVSYFSGMNGGLDGSYNTNGFMLNGEQHWRKQLTVDFDYFEMLKLPILQGRSFSKSYPADSSRKMRATVVNETLFKLLGKTAKLGEFNEPLQETIVGVVKDYNFESLTQKIQPEDHVLPRGGYVSNFMFKIQAGHVSESIEKIGAEWKNITAGYPYEYTFMDQNIQKMYESDQRWMSVIQFACFFAVFIACLGLFGLSSINAINRFKEIGIRKILGASVADIVSTLSLKFVLWVGISIVIAIPIAWIVMNRYLEDFAYRIKIGWMLPAAVGVLAVVIAFITISIQAIRAALANPVSSLQSE